MSRINELRQDIADVRAEMEALLDAAESEGRDLSEDENRAFATLESRKTRLSTRLSLAEEEADAVRSAPAKPAAAAPLSVKDLGDDDPKAGFRDLADFALAVHGASRPGSYADDRLLRMAAAPTNFHQETGGTAGEGYLVPPAMRQGIWELVFNGEDLLNLVNPEPTNANSVELVTDETTPWGATGVQASWRSEGQQMSASKMSLKAEQVKLHELYAFVLSTDELLQDAPRLNARLQSGASRAIRWKASEAIMTGTGAGQPLGYFTSSAKVSVAKETSQTADTVVAANVAKMFARSLNPGGSVWLINSDVVPQLLTMTLGDQPIWTPPASGFAGAPGGFLFGRPVIISEHADTVGDQGDIQFIDPQGYYATTRDGGPQFASSIHLFFDYGVQAFRWTFRFGGQPFLTAPVTPAKSAATKSHFVVLDARA
jgi:HK97 family phage major capsid protein